MSNEIIKDINGVLRMLDSLLREPAPFWNSFYKDRNKKIPFFINAPDENLVAYVSSGQLSRGKVLELGCGPGRNAIYLARLGFEVDAVDISEEAISWAQERAHSLNVTVNFICKSVFDLMPQQEEYDFVYDSGCLHHIWPHRRIEYLEMINKALKPSGQFGLTCFAPGFTDLGGAQELSDWEVYRDRSMKGGQAYSEEKLKLLLNDHFENLEFRKMNEYKESDDKFGVSFLWTSLWRKR